MTWNLEPYEVRELVEKELIKKREAHAKREQFTFAFQNGRISMLKQLAPQLGVSQEFIDDIINEFKGDNFRTQRWRKLR